MDTKRARRPVRMLLLAGAVAWVVVLGMGNACADPARGKVFKLKQPDGTLVEVRIWGDEFYQVVESLDGYTVVRDPGSQMICYAKLSADKHELVSTKIRLQRRAPKTLRVKRHVRISRVSKREKIRVARRRFNAGRPGVARRGGPQAAPPQGPTTGQRFGLCILIQFPDEAGTIPRSEVELFCNQPGYSGYGNNGSVRDYFESVSGGQLIYTNTVTAYYTAQNNKGYYDNPAEAAGPKARELILEALNWLENNGFDFSTLDGNGDGNIDGINAYYAGFRQSGWAKGLWPHSSYVNFAADGVQARKYQITDMQDELSLGTFCHENGHMVCDFPDLYDYGYESYGVGAFGLMGFGNFPKSPVKVCAYLKYKAGWMNVTELTSSSSLNGSLSSFSNACYRFVNPANAKEYYLIENRNRNGRDASLPGSGLAIWHVDEDGSNDNEQRTTAQHYECTLVQADNMWHLENKVNSGDAQDLFYNGNSTTFNENTAPAALWWNGAVSGLKVSNVSTAASTMTFTIGTGGTSQPDLIVESIAHAPANPSPGETVTFTVTVRNLGSTDAGLFSTGFWSDRATIPTIGITPEQERDSSVFSTGDGFLGLRAGQTGQLVFNVTAPAAGSYTAWAYADRFNGISEVAESDENNNAGPPGGHAWTVAAVGGDAYETDDTFAQAKTIAGGSPQTHSIHVAGDKDYVQFTLAQTSDIILETSGVSGDTVLYLYDASQVQIALDDDGGSVLFSRIVSNSLAAGTYYAMIEEYGNNGTIDSYTLSLTVSPSSTPQPDLIVEAITHTPADPSPGDTVTFTVTVRNQGTADAGLFNVGFWSDRTTIPVISTTPEQNADINSLAAGALTQQIFNVTAPAAGSYTAWAYADRFNGISEVAESDENNNAGPPGGHAWTVTVVSGDAYETDDTFAQAKTITSGSPQTHSIHVAGDKDYVQFTLSQTSDIILETSGVSGDTVLYLYDASQIQIAWDDDGGSALFSRIASNNLAAGTYYAMVEEYGNNGIIDSYTLSFTASPPSTPQPDLIVESITHTPANPTPGETVTFTVTVRNLGSADAGLFASGFWSDQLSAPLISTAPEAQQDIGSLAAGASTQLVFSVTAPAAGSYTAWAYADRFNGTSEVNESDESNNAGPSGGHAWTVASTTKPDLIVESITHAPANPAPGETVTFTVTVRNLGSVDAGLFATGFWSDQLSAPLISTAPEAQQDIGSLAAGASAQLVFSVTAPAAGSYTAWAYADRFNGTSEVNEFNENNNAGPPGGHAWTVTVVSGDAYETDNTFAQAKTIASSSPQTHSMHVAGDQDYVQFTLAQASNIILETSGVSGDTVLYLYDASQIQIAWDDDSGSALFSRIASNNLAAGTYYAMVEEYGNNGTIDSYTLTLTVTGINPPTADAQAVQTIESTPLPITLTGSDPDNDPLTFAIAASPANGTISAFDPNTGTLTYTPNIGYVGTDSFTFTVNDGTAASPAAAVTIDVSASGGGSGGAGDADLYVRRGAFTINWRAHNAGNDAGDLFLLSGNINLNGVPADLTGVSVRIDVNGTQLGATRTLDSAGRFASPRGDAPNYHYLLRASRGAYSLRVSKTDLRSFIPGFNPALSESGQVVVEVRLLLSGGGLAAPIDLTNFLRFDYTTRANYNTRGRFIFRRHDSLNGAFLSLRAIATEPRGGGGHLISVRGVIAPAGGGPLIPVDDPAAISVTLGTLPAIAVPFAALNVGGITPERSVYSYNRRKMDLSPLRRCTINNARRNFILSVGVVDAGIPLSDKPVPAAHELLVRVEVMTANGPFTFETRVELLRRRLTRWMR